MLAEPGVQLRMRDEQMQAARAARKREVEQFVSPIESAHAVKVLRGMGVRATFPQVDRLST